MSETFEEQEEWTEEEGADAPAESEPAPSGGSPRSRDISFGTMANRNLQRARKTIISKGEGDDDAAQAQFLVQAATVYAILDLADAVRKQDK
jgi:hypothetical protein